MRLALEDLSEVEQRVVGAVVDGGWPDLAGDGVRAELIRQLLSGQFRWPDGVVPDPRGVRLRGVVLENQLDLTDIDASLPLFLIDCRATEPVLLTRARLQVADLSGLVAPGVVADSLQVDHHLILDRARLHSGSDLSGALELSEAKIGGQLRLNDARLSSANGPALHAEYLRTGSSLYLRRLEASGSGEPGTVRLRSAHIGGALECRGAHLENAAGPALSAYGVTVDGGVFLHGDFRAAGVGPLGAVNLQSASIGGTLELDGAQVVNPSGPAVYAYSVRTTRSVVVLGRARFAANGVGGALNLHNARIGGHLNLSDAQLTNIGGPALVASGIRAVSDVLLGNGFNAGNAITLHGARIDGRLTCTGTAAAPGNAEGPVLVLSEVQVGHEFRIAKSFVGGGQVALDGLTYQGVPAGGELMDWLELIGRGTAAYKDQPYLQLAAAYKAAGHERDVRRIHIARQRDLLRRGELGGWARLWHRVTGVTLGYGYRPGIALVWLALVFAMSIGLITGVAGPNQLAARASGQPCSTIEQVGLALNATTPLFKPDPQARCQLNTATVGAQVVVLATWILQALAWAFATLFVAGFTGLVRRTA
jgi:hypothetical protein